MNYQKHDAQMKLTKIAFFEYMVDHACCCTSDRCICKASTFQDTVAELRNMTKDENELRDYNEVLQNCRNVKNDKWY